MSSSSSAADVAASTRRTSLVSRAVVVVVIVVAGVFISQTAYNSWYFLFKTVHVLSALVWVGGGALIAILAVVAERKRDPAEMAHLARQAAWVGQRVFAPAGLLVLLMGIAMMINTDWGWGSFWVIVGLAGYLATFLTGLLVLGPMAARVDGLIADRGAEAPETTAAIERLLMISRIDLGVLVIVVVDMIVKPFS
jgi:uncharacterized membrane protein